MSGILVCVSQYECVSVCLSVYECVWEHVSLCVNLSACICVYVCG